MNAKHVTLLVTAALAAILVPLAAGSTTETVQLRVSIPWSGTGVAPCPTAQPATVQCHARPGGLILVRGLGHVVQEYLYPVESAGCVDTYRIPPYPAKLTVLGRGELILAVDGVDSCLDGPPSNAVLRPTQTFTVTGGTGVFAGASGSGQVSRTETEWKFDGHGLGTDHWEGSITAPSLQLDLAAPTFAGARAKSVKAPRGAKTVTVRFRVTARDAVDGVVAVRCSPASGSRFRVGRRTNVHCHATDASANTATARFAVTVRRR